MLRKAHKRDRSKFNSWQLSLKCHQVLGKSTCFIQYSLHILFYFYYNILNLIFSYLFRCRHACSCWEWWPPNLNMAMVDIGAMAMVGAMEAMEAMGAMVTIMARERQRLFLLLKLHQRLSLNMVMGAMEATVMDMEVIAMEDTATATVMATARGLLSPATMVDMDIVDMVMVVMVMAMAMVMDMATMDEWTIVQKPKIKNSVEVCVLGFRDYLAIYAYR